MTKTGAARINRLEATLCDMGFTPREVAQLRRASNTLRRWYELECGNGNNYGSWAIERDEATEKPYMVRHYYAHGAGKDRVIRTPIADRETGARKRIAALCAARGVRHYVQTDPRGASLYILRPEDVREGEDISSVYPRGVCVW